MTGPLILKDNPAEDLEAATKQYVDNHTSDVVLYTPQTLSDEQKAQARGNINSAPGGFGLGTVSVAFSDANDCIINGWYRDPDGNAKNTPWKWSHILVTTFLPNTYVRQDAYITGGPASVPSVNHAVRIKHPDFPEENAFWGPWEYESGIPMQLGIEYRTTERFWGRPVYYKIVDCGQIADNKQVEHGIMDMRDCIFCQGLRGAMPMPSISNNDLSDPWSYYVADVDRTKITLACGTSAAEGNCHVILKYTKTTD